MFLDILPPLAHVRECNERDSLHRSLVQIMQELKEQQPESRLIVENLAITMLAQALRSYAMHDRTRQIGWLFALSDPQIGVAISAMHENPAHRWSVQLLANQAGMSRTNFAVRFMAGVGSAPMTYLTRLRMMLASQRLSVSSDTIHLVAETHGYSSESAFSNAFKRQFGDSPRQFINRLRASRPPA